jgi:hypothetical protein
MREITVEQAAVNTPFRRGRWAAIGAAVAVTIGGGAVVPFVSATSSSGTRAVVTSITPCRLFDTRPAPNTVGPRATPLGQGDTHASAGRGVVGNCNIPAGAIGLVMNVTVVDGTAGSFLTVFPSDAPTRPLASSLNWTAGQAATPNQVTSLLSADGKVSFFNNAGSVNVLVDVVGFLEDHNHDDRYVKNNQPIVMSYGTGGMVPVAAGPTTISRLVAFTAGSGDGALSIDLPGPEKIDGVAYGLQSVEYCIAEASAGGFVDTVVVFTTALPFVNSTPDLTNRSAVGCYTHTVNLAGSQGYSFGLALGGGAGQSVVVGGVKATWVPASQIPAPLMVGTTSLDQMMAQFLNS